METSIGNLLTYHGKVDIYTILKSGKQIHTSTLNHGKQAISELFTRACLGYSVLGYIPKKLDITDLDGESILYSPIELRAASYQVVEDGGEYDGWKYPTFDALVLREDISTELSNQPTQYHFNLLTSSNEILAQITVTIQSANTAGDAENTLYLRDGNSILIRWSLFITNMNE